jgi:hypothetical protein
VTEYLLDFAQKFLIAEAEQCTLRCVANPVQEDGEVAVVRGMGFPAQMIASSARVVEPELDMHRLDTRQSSTGSIFRELVRKLLPAGNSLVQAPMRSIAREIEEAWPARDP